MNAAVLTEPINSRMVAYPEVIVGPDLLEAVRLTLSASPYHQ
jgi:hypothetical protein